MSDKLRSRPDPSRADLARRDVLRLAAVALVAPYVASACKRPSTATLGELKLSTVLTEAEAFNTLAGAARKSKMGDPKRVADLRGETVDDVKAALTERIRADATAGRLFPVRGWMMTQTEVDLICFAFPA